MKSFFKVGDIFSSADLKHEPWVVVVHLLADLFPFSPFLRLKVTSWRRCSSLSGWSRLTPQRHASRSCDMKSTATECRRRIMVDDVEKKFSTSVCQGVEGRTALIGHSGHPRSGPLTLATVPSRPASHRYRVSCHTNHAQSDRCIIIQCHTSRASHTPSFYL